MTLRHHLTACHSGNAPHHTIMPHRRAVSNHFIVSVAYLQNHFIVPVASLQNHFIVPVASLQTGLEIIPG
jgi:hypothetical protein